MVIGLRFYILFQLTVSPRFFAFFRQYPGRDAIAATAIRRLDGMIRGTLPAARTILPYHLIVRDSS